MRTVCKKNECVGCMACIDVCAQSAIKIEDSLCAYNAVIQEDKCINCNACNNVCANCRPAETKKPEQWLQGWALDEDIRFRGSSGGLASEIARTFLVNGGVVCSCVFLDGMFRFDIVDKVEDLQKFAGSKYVKSNPIGVYQKIKSRLCANQRVLFVGLPCQVAALKNYVGDVLGQNLFTIDLICHGTPSPKVLDIFLRQYGIELTSLDDIRFREKTLLDISSKYTSILDPRVSDTYSIGFLNALFYTDNCYKCNYAREERVADITLGDSWGSTMSEEQKKKGISLVLCQSQKGKELLKHAQVYLEQVDKEKAIANNHQLKSPSMECEGRKEFFRQICCKKKFNRVVGNLLPKYCIRQFVKLMLVKMRIFKVNRVVTYGVSVKTREI